MLKGLLAKLGDAYVVTMLVDDSHDVLRLRAVVRITAWTGTLTNPEAKLCIIPGLLPVGRTG
ncbi:hypothetical protein [Streptomyces sp. NPDC094032]|uniref:hypothetical protein n=1 Tax=Streptomyces sp. NPDC094032 TaxID=3155308 RepID=UPI00331CD074